MYKLQIQNFLLMLQLLKRFYAVKITPYNDQNPAIPGEWK